MSRYSVKIGNATLSYLDSSDNLEVLERILSDAFVSYGTDWDSLASYLVRSKGFTVTTYNYSFDYKLELSYSAWLFQVRVVDKQGVQKYNGQLTGFSKKMKTFNWHDVNGKMVRFTYEGGSNPGTTRLVKVKTYKDGNIYTTDLINADARTFSVANIKNPEVVTL